MGAVLPDRCMVGVGVIRCVGPIRVGTGQESVDAGSLIARDDSGRPVIWGETLAGVLRSLARDLSLVGEYGAAPPCLNVGPDQTECNCTFCRLMGSVHHPSALTVHSAHIAGEAASGDGLTEVRDHVGIGRRTRTHAAKRLFNQEVAIGGLAFTFDFSLRADGGDYEGLKALLLDCLALWRRWGGRVGAGSGSGTGHFRLESCRVEQLDLRTEDDLCRWLLSDSPAELVGDESPEVGLLKTTPRSFSEIQCLAHPEGGDDYPLPERLRWVLRLHPTGPIMVKTEFGAPEFPEPELMVEDANGAAQTPLPLDVDASFVTRRTLGPGANRVEHYIPGSSLRGVLRSHSERILRTVAMQHLGDQTAYFGSPQTIVCDPHEDDTPRLRRCDACVPETVDRRLAREVQAAVCPACRLFGSTLMGGKLLVSEAAPLRPEAYGESLKLLQHVAIDRFSGGASAQKLFNERPAYPVPDPNGHYGDDLDMEFSFELVAPEPWEIALVLFLLRDLAQERVRLWYAKFRGMGRAQVQVVGWEALLVEGSPLQTAVGDQGACLGPLRHVSKDALDGLESWRTALPDLATLAVGGWSDFVGGWLNGLTGQVPQEG